MKQINKILLIIQRSNGDVFFSNSLIHYLTKNFFGASIDLLINDDTIATARTLSNINKIHLFSYKKKKQNRYAQELKILNGIYKKYDLAINLTASDRSVLYCLLSGKKTISAVEPSLRKSWWKRIFLSHSYIFDINKHILLNNFEALNILKLQHSNRVIPIQISEKTNTKVKNYLSKENLTQFFIFHPSAQYDYKIYPEGLRNELIRILCENSIKIVVTGGNSYLDKKISKTIPKNKGVINLIGKTSLEEYAALSKHSLGYIGMDTLNMHIAASQNKRLFCIFGPTNINMWSPWSNHLKTCASDNLPVQTYGEITIFQAGLPCVPCGKAGCNDQHDKSLCLDHINPDVVYQEIQNFVINQKI